ncbi:hypothetical protein BDZ91DRAFT_791205 [Kalaharituber pfeilii]|nr:hypothetical protein BDZ91DRAFT_791205 [Kalaharituber pfeilii]
MEAQTMQNCEPGLELLSTAVLPLTVTDPTVTTPTAISLGQSMQGARQFLILLPPGVEPQGILCSRTVMESSVTSSNNLPGGVEVPQPHAQNVNTYNCNQLPALVNDPFPGYGTIITSDRNHDSDFNNLSPAVPDPSSHYLEMVNYAMHECLPDVNQNGIEDIVSSMMDQSNLSTHFDSQNPQPIFNAAAAASQQSEIILWMSPMFRMTSCLPHHFRNMISDLKSLQFLNLLPMLTARGCAQH